MLPAMPSATPSIAIIGAGAGGLVLARLPHLSDIGFPSTKQKAIEAPALTVGLSISTKSPASSLCAKPACTMIFKGLRDQKAKTYALPTRRESSTWKKLIRKVTTAQRWIEFNCVDYCSTRCLRLRYNGEVKFVP